MGLFSSVKFGDVISGAAKSLDDRLKDDMRRTQERSERVREYHITRKRAKEERFETEQRDLKDVLNNLASLVQDDDIPQGMTKYDYAAQLYNAGGGTITGGQTMFANLTSEKMKGNTNIKALMGLADTETGGKGISEYIDRFANRPSEITKLPKELTGGVGLMGKLFDVDTSAGLSEEMKSMFPERAAQPTFDVPTAAVDYSGMSGAKEYEQSQTLTDLQIRQATANLAETERKAGIENAWSNSELRANISDITGSAEFSGVPLNDDGTIDVKTAKEQNIDIGDALTNIVSRASRAARDNTGTLLNKGNIATLVSLASTPGVNGGYAVNRVGFTPQTEANPKTGTVYDMVDNDGNLIPHLYIADTYVRLY